MSLFDDNLLSMANVAPAAPVAAFHGLGDDAWLQASRSLAATAHPQDMVRPFLPWQAAAYNYANDSIARWGGALLGDDMGMGKTQVLLALAADATRHGGYVIVVSPTVAEAGYRSDLFASFPHLTLHVVRGRKIVDLPPADIYFISDDPLTLKAWLGVEYKDAKGKVQIEASAWAKGANMIIRDEIHRDKGNQGKPSVRSKVLLAVGAAARAAGRAVIGATGTLLTNRPVESYLPLQIIGGDRLLLSLTPGANRPSAYLWRYCAPVQKAIGGGRTAMDFRGIDMAACETLHEYLRRTVYVRREKSDLGEGVLPHSGWIVKPLALTPQAMRRYQRVEKDFLALVMEERGAEAMWRAERSKAIVQMQAMWAEAGAAKAEAAVDYIETLVENGEQVVAFYHHTDVLTHLMTHLIKAGITFNIINGSVTGDARTDAIDEFQESGVQVCLAQIKSAGMAVTLTAACHAVFVQVPWSAGDLKQAADRFLRVDNITRDRAAAGGRVTWHVIQACYDNGDPTFDAAMWGVLEAKAHVCDAVNAGRQITLPDEAVMFEALKAWVPNARRHGGW